MTGGTTGQYSTVHEDSAPQQAKTGDQATAIGMQRAAARGGGRVEQPDTTDATQQDAADQTTRRQRAPGHQIAPKTTPQHTTMHDGIKNNKTPHKTAWRSRALHDANRNIAGNAKGTRTAAKHSTAEHRKTPRTTRKSRHQTRDTAQHQGQPPGKGAQHRRTTHTPHKRLLQEGPKKEPNQTHAKAKGTERRELPSSGGRNEERREGAWGEQPQGAEAQGTRGQKQRKGGDKGTQKEDGKKERGLGGNNKPPRPRALKAGNNGKAETRGAPREKNKEITTTTTRAHTAQKRPKESQTATGTGRRSRKRPGDWPARPNQDARLGENNHTHTGCQPARPGQDARQARTNPQTHTRADPGMMSCSLKGMSRRPHKTPRVHRLSPQSRDGPYWKLDA